jgi:hypothetical protein
VAALTVPAQAQAASPPARPTLAATVSTCRTGLTADERTVVFTGAMPAMGKAVSMAMRFDLFERPGDTGPYTRVRIPGFSVWTHSDPDVAGFVYDKRVEMLAAPSAYRVEVRFRWFDAHGRVVKRATRTSAACRQPDLRPDLHVTRLLLGAPRPDDTAVYTVTVANTGRTAVTLPFATGLSVNGVPLAPQELRGLDAGGVTTLTFTGPRCVAGSSVLATVDAGRAVDEAGEGDNTGRATCAT